MKPFLATLCGLGAALLATSALTHASLSIMARDRHS